MAVSKRSASVDGDLDLVCGHIDDSTIRSIVGLMPLALFVVFVL